MPPLRHVASSSLLDLPPEATLLWMHYRSARIFAVSRPFPRAFRFFMFVPGSVDLQ